MSKKLTGKEKIEKIFNNFELFAKNFIFITDNNNDVIPFDLNEAQQEIDKLSQKNRYIIVGKARQSGVSTMMLAKALYRALTNENENILIVSYKSDSAFALFEMLKRMNQYIPRERYKGIFPTVKRENRNELTFNNGSRIKSIVAGNKDIGRGETYTYIHLSEFAFYGNQERQLLSVEQSLAKGNNSQITIETTSNGTNNHYFTLYNNALKGESKFVPVFIPWFHKLYRKQFRNDIDEAVAWHMANNKGKRLSESELEEDEIPLFKLSADLRQIMWRRWKIMDMSGIEQFYQEFPSSPMESFISTSESIFDQSKVIERLNHTIPHLTKQEVLEQAPDFPSDMIKYLNKGLKIFHLPENNMRYFGGSDVASGSGGRNDSSSMTIFDSDGQMVLTFENNTTPVYQFAKVLNDLGLYYNYTYLCVERNSYGLPVIERLRSEYTYINLYKQNIFDQKGRKKKQLGMTTTASTKPIFISDFKESFETGLINIECKTTLQQMQMFIMTENKKMGNKSGANNHDDLVISSAMAIVAMKENKSYV